MSDAVITIDAAERVTTLNAAAEAMMGMAEADAVGRSCGEVVRSEICGRFREDVYYRLNVVPIIVPHLRDRKGDIPLLISSIPQRLTAKLQCKTGKISPEAMNILMTYDWPGNVRELENALEFALIRKTRDTLLPQVLPPWITGGERRTRGFLKDATKEREREEIVKTLARRRGKVSDVANTLGVGRTTL
jgi:transcriptional regulator with PAS, ATPase and Fis domain